MILVDCESALDSRMPLQKDTQNKHFGHLIKCQDFTLDALLKTSGTRYHTSNGKTLANRSHCNRLYDNRQSNVNVLYKTCMDLIMSWCVIKKMCIQITDEILCDLFRLDTNHNT